MLYRIFNSLRMQNRQNQVRSAIKKSYPVHECVFYHALECITVLLPDTSLWFFHISEFITANYE